MKWIYPLDPECPDVILFNNRLPDMRAFGAPIEDFLEDFQKAHSRTCERCRDYGLANVGVGDGR